MSNLWKRQTNRHKCLVFQLGLLFLLLSGCDREKIVVPDSDTTPPTVSMSIDYTTSDGNRKTAELTPTSAPISVDLDPNEPIAVVASGRDKDGGVMGVIISGSIADFCEGDVLGNILDLPIEVPKTGGAGDTAATVEVIKFTFNPLDRCPNGNSDADGNLAAVAENFHNGESETASFTFSYK